MQGQAMAGKVRKQILKLMECFLEKQSDKMTVGCKFAHFLVSSQ